MPVILQAGAIVAPTTGNPVNIRGLIGTQISNPANRVVFDSSANTTGKSTTLAFTYSNGASTFVNMPQGTLATPDIDNNLSGANFSTVNVDKVQVNTLPTSSIINPKFISGTSNVQFVSDPTNNTITTNLNANLAPGAVVDITFPSLTQILGANSPLVFTQLQTFNAGLKTDSLNGLTTNGDIIISNGVSQMAVNNPQQQLAVLAKTLNSNLSLSGNGTGAVAFDTKGLKFTNGLGILKDYTINSFVGQVTCGTFNSGNKTIQFERVGINVTLKFPVVTGTPNVDQIWILNNLPANLKPTTDQIFAATIGIKNNVSLGQMYCKIRPATNDIAFSFSDDTTGFGTVGTCGWQNTWAITYILN